MEPITLKANNSPLVSVKTKYGSESTVGAREGRGNFGRLAESAILNVYATTKKEKG